MTDIEQPKPASLPQALLIPEHAYTAIEAPQTARVLTLQPAATQYDPLFGSLNTIHLDSPSRPSYETISYVWGKPVLSDIIILDGTIHWLTRNLASALRRVRRKKESRVVWADQVCVNQKDFVERNQQVKLMGKLYKEAANVLVWLGEDDEGMSEKTTDLLKELDVVFEGKMGARDGKASDSYDARLMQISENRWMALRTMTFMPWVSQRIPIQRDHKRAKKDEN